MLLGILKVQSQHGYQINEFIERNLHAVTDMKKATAYATLDRLSTLGHVDVQIERVGNRPPRRVYAITAAGERHFQELLRTNLAGAERMSASGMVGLMFVDHLPREEAAALLRQRVVELTSAIESYAQAPAHPDQVGVDLAVSRQLALLRADRNWLAAAIGRLTKAAPSVGRSAGSPRDRGSSQRAGVRTRAAPPRGPTGSPKTPTAK